MSAYGDPPAAGAHVAETPQAELERLRRALGLKSFQLESLFELSRELAQSLDESLVQDLLLPTLMGHLAVSRCALFVAEGEGVRLAASRGLRPVEGTTLELAELLRVDAAPHAASALAPGCFKSHVEELRLTLVVPAEVGVTRGWLVLGPRPPGLEFGGGECELALTLARQALTVIETVRLHHLRLEKLRQDRELALAREIQETLLPRAPSAGVFDVAAASRPCQAVGGDYYDFIALDGGRLGLVVADVSGKGTPASLLMASVHAAVRVLCGTLPPVELISRVNRMLYDSTQAHRYVTLFYAVCDPVAGELEFVNAGHVPPLHMAADGTLTPLTEGGLALGFVGDAVYELGRRRLLPGDVLALVTDGVTEALSPQDEEYGMARLCARLQAARGQGAAQVLDGLVGDVLGWCGVRGCSDDLTAVLLRRP